MGCGSADFVRGLRDIRSMSRELEWVGSRAARKEIGRCLTGGGRGGNCRGNDRASSTCNALFLEAEALFQGRQTKPPRGCSNFSVSALRDLEGRGMSSLGGGVFASMGMAKLPSSFQIPSRWPTLHHYQRQQQLLAKGNCRHLGRVPPAMMSSSTTGGDGGGGGEGAGRGAGGGVGQRDGTAENVDRPPSLFMGHQLKRFSHFRDGNVQWRKFLEVKRDVRDTREDGFSPGREVIQSPNGNVENGIIIHREQQRSSSSSDVTVICFDIETTGLGYNYNDRIIEFAARDLAGGFYSTIETLVNPDREVTNTYIHNITNDMVNNPGVPRWKDVGLAIIDFVESRRKGQGPVILVAHNGKVFDVPFILTECQARGLSIPSYWRFADSLQLARLAGKRAESLGRARTKKTKLSALCSYYNLPFVGEAHRAMADVNMLAQILQKLMNDLEMSPSELLAKSFGLDDVVLKSKDSVGASLRGPGVGNGVKLVDMAALGREKIAADRVMNHSGPTCPPWDR